MGDMGEKTTWIVGIIILKEDTTVESVAEVTTDVEISMMQPSISWGGGKGMATTRDVWKKVPVHIVTWLTGLVTS